MNYEKIIIELLSRIQVLEERAGIASGSDDDSLQKMIADQRKKNKMSTAEIKKWIQEFLEDQKRAGKDYAELVCGEIHKQLELKNAVPMVCNAMKSCMKPDDTFLFRSPSGFSATLKIRYSLTKGSMGAKNMGTTAQNIGIQPELQKPAIQKAIKPEAKPEVKADIREDRQIGIETAATMQPRSINMPVSPRQKEADLFVQAEGKAGIKLDPKPEIKPQTGLSAEQVKKTATVQPPMTADEVWKRIIIYEWAIFYLPDGGEFAYIAGSDYLAIVRSNYRLPRKDIERALELYPFKNTVPLQHLRYPSYIYAILTDERIMGLPR